MNFFNLIQVEHYGFPYNKPDQGHFAFNIL